MSGRPAPLVLYGLATGLAEPFAPMLLGRRARRGKEDPARLGERLGRATLARPAGALVWIHAVSVGESLSHLPVVERLRSERPDLTILVTSGTRTSAELLARRLPAGVLHQYAPIDAPAAAARFLDHWRPSLALFIESELWPNLLDAARRRGVRLVLLGARISENSARAWDRAPAAARSVLGLFDLIYAQDLETRDWVEDHGAEVAGRLDLKRLAEPLPCDEAELERLAAACNGRKAVVAASTHPGEETMIAAAIKGLEPRPLLIVVPRHPERGAEVAAELQALGWRVARRSRAETPGPEAEAYIADTLGELGLFYRLADAVVLGGAFREGLSGHNPLEPARFSRPVVTGPHHDSFAEIYADLIAEKAVLIASGGAELKSALQAMLFEPGVADALGRRAEAVASGGRLALDEAWARLQPLWPAP